MVKAFIQQRFPNNNKAILVGMVPFMELDGKVWLSYRDKSLSELGNEEEKKSYAYQRQIDQSRVSSIAQFIVGCLIANSRKSADVIFPNSIILAFQNDDEILDENRSLHDQIFGDNDVVRMSVPENTMIVDGQHRYAAMKYLYNKAKESTMVFGYSSLAIIDFIEKYEFNCSILFNYDMWEQAQIFANVNFNQKKVNKSLFYDIYGVSIPLDDSTVIPRQNEIFLAHTLVAFLNNNEKSSLRGFVKMLGSGHGYVSQAFLVEALMRLMTPNGVWSDALSMLRSHDQHYNYVALELVAYLNSVKETFDVVWPKENETKPSSIICKTTGLGALILLLSELHKNMDEKVLLQLKKESFSNETYAEVRSFFTKKMKPLSDYAMDLFSLTGDYANGSGFGMQKRLYREMIRLLSLL